MLKIEKQILKHEGFEPFPYKCPAGKLTIGIGRNLDDRGITMDEALILLRNDIAACEFDLYKIFGKEFFELDIARKHALIGMRFNLGATGFRGFTKMIQAIRNQNFIEAAQEIEKSVYWGQVGERARTLQSMILHGGEG
jgi:lysozyme